MEKVVSKADAAQKKTPWDGKTGYQLALCCEKFRKQKTLAWPIVTLVANFTED